ncbi:FMN reductase [Duganella sp. 3397]|uniref:NADPH-dependent FMN reductase n=1 Tax=Duganella sp. 3397 TaxID=2817732 RepID=UPI00285E1E41|nr:NADPH-dependent FMN reductase [Duganella sp. 3397]MDR7049442.1 FMN reductase [Duganella sp. 3397]
MSILLLGGSPAAVSSTGRLLDHVAEKLAERLGDIRPGHRYTKVQVRELPAHALLQAETSDLAIKRAIAAVADADAVIIATPVYKASYTGLLKAFLDLLPQDGLAGKLVLPLATGGSQSHMLALDYALRPVLHALDARHVLAGIYATSSQLVWNEGSGLAVDQAIAWRVEAGVEGLAAALHGQKSWLEQLAQAPFVAPVEPIRLAR